MPVSVFVVDAFTTAEPFSGNPAAVCPLDSWLPDPLLQHIASEHNLSETAFFVPAERGYHLRWFTPNCEVDLCGHATLGCAYVLFAQLGHPGSEVRFQTNVAGELRVRREDDLFGLDFPARAPQRVSPIPELKTILGIEPDRLCSDAMCCRSGSGNQESSGHTAAGLPENGSAVVNASTTKNGNRHDVQCSRATVEQAGAADFREQHRGCSVQLT